MFILYIHSLGREGIMREKTGAVKDLHALSDATKLVYYVLYNYVCTLYITAFHKRHHLPNETETSRVKCVHFVSAHLQLCVVPNISIHCSITEARHNRM